MARAISVPAALALALTLALAPTAPGSAAAAADDGLTGSAPPADAVLAVAPAAVELTFAGEPELTDSHVTVLDARLTAVSTGDPQRADRRTLRQPVRPGSTGDLTVAWHVSFRDGRQSRGTLRFSVGTGRPPAPAGPALDRATAELLDSHQHRIDPLSAVLLVVNAAVVLGAVTLLAVRDPRRPRAWRLPAEFGGSGPPTGAGHPGPAPAGTHGGRGRTADHPTERGTT